MIKVVEILLLRFSFVNESMFNLFVSIKPNIQKFTLLIEKLTSKKNSLKYEFFSTKFGFDLDLIWTFKNKAISINRKILIFF